MTRPVLTKSVGEKPYLTHFSFHVSVLLAISHPLMRGSVCNTDHPLILIIQYMIMDTVGTSKVTNSRLYVYKTVDGRESIKPLPEDAAIANS